MHTFECIQHVEFLLSNFDWRWNNQLRYSQTQSTRATNTDIRKGKINY